MRMSLPVSRRYGLWSVILFVLSFMTFTLIFSIPSRRWPFSNSPKRTRGTSSAWCSALPRNLKYMPQATKLGKKLQKASSPRGNPCIFFSHVPSPYHDYHRSNIESYPRTSATSTSNPAINLLATRLILILRLWRYYLHIENKNLQKSSCKGSIPCTLFLKINVHTTWNLPSSHCRYCSALLHSASIKAHLAFLRTLHRWRYLTHIQYCRGIAADFLFLPRPIIIGLDPLPSSHCRYCSALLHSASIKTLFAKGESLPQSDFRSS